jgi:hypothetical protein
LEAFLATQTKPNQTQTYPSKEQGARRLQNTNMNMNMNMNMKPRIFLLSSIWIWMAVLVATASDNHPVAIRIRHRASAMAAEQRQLQTPAGERENSPGEVESTTTYPPEDVLVPTPTSTQAPIQAIFDVFTQLFAAFVDNIGQILLALDHAVEVLGNNTSTAYEYSTQDADKNKIT